MIHVQGFLLLGLTMLLLGCGATYQAPVGDLEGGPRFTDSGRLHRVNSGETLYVIAWMYDLDFAALARVNNLREPYSISPGQLLTVDLRGQAAPANTTQTTSLAATSRNGTAPANTAVTAVNPVQVGGASISRAPLPSSGRPSRTPLGETETAPSSAITPPAVTTAPPATALPPATTSSPPPAATTPPVSQPGATLPPATVAVPPATPPAPAPSVAAVIPSTSPSNDAVVWAWPYSGDIVGRFSESGSESKGIDLAGNAGDAVLAAADGEVVYAGSGLLHYGNLIIIKHSDRFLSAYAHNRTLVVNEKDRVTKGQKIAELGSSGIDRNLLHFEIRVDGKPEDPLQYLPAR